MRGAERLRLEGDERGGLRRRLNRRRGRLGAVGPAGAAGGRRALQLPQQPSELAGVDRCMFWSGK